MENLKRDNIIILRRFIRNKEGKKITGSISDIADKYGLRVCSSKTKISTFYKENSPNFILNWGNSIAPPWLTTFINDKGVVLNKPGNVSNAIDKVHTLNLCRYKGIPTLNFTSMIDKVRYWLNETDNTKVYCRTLTKASQGKGIVIANTVEEIVPAGLYTLGYNNNREYRVHVFQGEVIDIQIKRKRTKDHLEELGIELNSDIRNISNGWVFCRSKCRRNKNMEKSAIRVVKELGLEFGAVDVLGSVVNNRLVKYAICEVNTAPALTGSTLEAYTYAINKYADKYALDIESTLKDIDSFSKIDNNDEDIALDNNPEEVVTPSLHEWLTPSTILSNPCLSLSTATSSTTEGALE